MTMPQSESNKLAARTVFEVWNGADPARLDEVVSTDVVHHDPYDPHASEGLAGLKRTIEVNRRTFPDLEITVEDQIAAAGKVATRWRAVMTHSAEVMGVPATGKRVAMSGITIDRFNGGRIVEAWRSMDMLGLLTAVRGSRGSRDGRPRTGDSSV